MKKSYKEALRVLVSQSVRVGDRVAIDSNCMKLICGIYDVDPVKVFADAQELVK